MEEYAGGVKDEDYPCQKGNLVVRGEFIHQVPEDYGTQCCGDLIDEQDDYYADCGAEDSAQNPGEHCEPGQESVVFLPVVLVGEELGPVIRNAVVEWVERID